MAATPDLIREPARDIPVRGEYNVVVLGGGPAGIAAAAAAGGARSAHPADRALRLSRRHGYGGGRHQFLRPARQRPRRDPPGGAWRRRRHPGAHRAARRAQRAPRDFRPHLCAGLRHRGLQMRGRRAPDRARRRADAPRARLRVVKEGDAIAALVVETRSGRVAVRSRIFIDCSGDGDLAQLAGAPLRDRRWLRQPALPDHDVPPERRRSGNAPATPGPPFRA